MITLGTCKVQPRKHLSQPRDYCEGRIQGQARKHVTRYCQFPLFIDGLSGPLHALMGSAGYRDRYLEGAQQNE